MGDNFSMTVVEQQVIRLYDLGVLTLPVLDVLCEPFRETDIDSGGLMYLTSKDGKELSQIAVELVSPDFKPNDPLPDEEWVADIHWSWDDEFSEICDKRWGWR